MDAFVVGMMSVEITEFANAKRAISRVLGKIQNLMNESSMISMHFSVSRSHIEFRDLGIQESKSEEKWGRW